MSGVEELDDYRWGELVEIKDDDGCWSLGVITELDPEDAVDRFRVMRKNDDWTYWYAPSRVRKATPAAPVRRLQYKLDAEGTPFTRVYGEWQTIEVGDAEMCIVVQPCAHHQNLLLRNAAPATDAEILAELRKLVESGAYTRTKVAKILSGEF